MGYAVALTRKAAEEFAAFPFDLAGVVDAHLGMLGDHPLRHGRKPYFPFRPGGLMSEFRHEFEDRTCYVRVFLHFGAGESSLVLTGFVVQAMGR